MKPKLISFFKYLLLLIISFGLLAFAFRGVNVNNIIHEIWKANLFWVLFSAFISVIALISRAYRWKLLIESAGYQPPLNKTLYALMIGYFANLAFPRLGEVTRCGSLSKAAAIPFTSLLGTVIVERVVDVISLVVCILLAAAIEYKRLANFLNDNILQPIIEKLTQLLNSPFYITIGIILAAAFIYFILYYSKKTREKRKESKLFQFVKGLVHGLRSIATLKRPWLFVFHSVFIWALYYLGVYVSLFALDSTADLGFGAALLLLVAGGIAMSAPVQGGIGAYHLLVSQGLMLYGLSQQDGLTFATLLHSLQLLLVIVFGVASLLLLFGGRKNIEADVKEAKR